MTGDSGPCWSEIRPGLVELFTELAQSPKGYQAPQWKAEWRDSGDRKATPVTGPIKGVTLTLRITTIAGVGDDDARLEDAGDDLQESIYGLRKVTLNLQCEAAHIDDSQWALSLLERIRTRMSRTRVVERLLDLNVGVIEILPARDVSAKSRQHTLSKANMDLLLTMVASDSDPVTTGVITEVWITTVELKDVADDEDGNPVLLTSPPDVPTIITSP